MLRPLAIVMLLYAPAAADEPRPEVHDNAPIMFALGWTLGGIELGPAPMGGNGLGGKIPSPSKQWDAYFALRAIGTRDGLGVIFSMGMTWGD